MTTVPALVVASLAMQAGSFRESGRPFIRTFGPRELGADPQNWAMVQDGRGMTYAANNQGVLTFDGERWRLVPTRGGSTPRALAVDGQGRVLVGAQGEFGYLEPGADGQARYVPLDTQLQASERPVGNIWSLACVGQDALFVTRERLYHWNGQHLRSWTTRKGFFMAYAVGTRLLVQDLGRGLLEWRGGDLVPAPEGHHLEGMRPRFLLPWNLGGEQGLLAGTRETGLLMVTPDRVRRLKTPADAPLAEQILYTGLRLTDGSLALATIQGGLICLDAELRDMRQLGTRDGLSSDTLYCLMEGRHGGLWVGGSRGVDLLGWPARQSRFSTAEGLPGVPVHVARHQGVLHVSTHLGVSRLKPSTGQGASFVPVQGLKGQCWQLLSDASGLLVANYDGVFEIRNGRAHRVADTGHSTALAFDPTSSNRLFVGTLTGLFALERARPGSPWHLTGRVGDITEEIQTLAVSRDGELWLGCDAPKVIRVTLGKGSPGITRFSASDGLPPREWCFTVRTRGAIRVITPTGILAFRADRGRFEPDPQLAAPPAPEAPVTRLAEAPEGTLWMTRQHAGTLLNALEAGPDGGFRWRDPANSTWIPGPTYSLFPEAAGVVWVGGTEGLLRLETAQEAPGPPERVLLRTPFPAPGQGGLPTAPYRRQALRFEFALPLAGPSSACEYQCRLEGLDSQWSPWSPEAYRDFTNLRWGRYRFQVRARRLPGGPISEADFSFRIQRPWHQRGWAYAAYLVGAGLLLTTLHRLRVRLLERRNRDLQTRIDEATLTLRERETRLQAQTAALESLNGDLRSLTDQQSRFLGIVSHDLKTPLHGIALAAESLQSTRAPESMRETARDIERESRNLASLVERFLNEQARSRGHLAVHPEAVNVETACLEALERHTGRASAKGIPLDLGVFDPNLEVQADPLLLAEVLDNLLSNALKFSSRHEAVQVEAEPRGAWIRIAVRDHGPGLKPEDLARLFTPYSRLSARPTAGEPSLGLGLSIVHQLVTAMDGRAGAETVSGGGTRFWFELPAQSSR